MTKLLYQKTNITFKLDFNESEDSDNDVGTTGEIVDLLNQELTDEEWNALWFVHNMTNRLGLGIQFEWTHSIDVRSKTTSQIVDESVFLNGELSQRNNRFSFTQPQKTNDWDR